MNNLNTTTRQRNKPETIKNLNIKDTNEKNYNKTGLDAIIERKQLNINQTKPTNEVEDKPDRPSLSDVERHKSRKVKKALGYAGWALCFPVMLAALALRDKPNPDDEDEWKDDPCLPWWYDVNFKYPGDDDCDDVNSRKLH